MAEPQNTAFDKQCLEALKSIGKTLGQMSLYKIGHPAVTATLQSAEEHITQALKDTTSGELTFSIDQDKVVSNGRIVGLVNALPNSVVAVFNRFKLASLTFRAGIENAELVAFIELASSRPDAQSAANAPSFLAERGVSHIVLNEAIYSKVGAAQSPDAVPTEAVAGTGLNPDEAKAQIEAQSKAVADAITRAAEEKSLDKMIRILVERSVPDAAHRDEVFKRVMQLLEEDVTKRIEEVVTPLRAERNRLQNEQTRTQGVIQNMVEGVIVVDEAGKIMMMNPAAEQIYGTKLGDVAGKPLSEKLGEEHMVALASEITTPSDRPIKDEVKVGGVDDTKRTLKSAGAVVQNEAGKVVGMVSSLTDVAKQKDFQRIQRDFVAHVTHELRAPLSSIRAALEILQGEISAKIREEDKKILGTALKNSDRLADLINSILDFSKIESGQMTVFPKKADPEKIAREAAESLGPWAAKKGIQLSTVASPDLPLVLADQSRTVQVLVNLLSNAIKFTPSGGRITVRAGVSANGQRFAPGDKMLEFSVQDTGTGIAKADQKRIFEKFIQIASGELHVGGTGLGLSIAKALVHLQGGKMWVDSDEGKGAVFAFTLPVYIGMREDAPAATARKVEAARPWWKKLLGLK